jgi:hypothetical protein
VLLPVGFDISPQAQHQSQFSKADTKVKKIKSNIPRPVGRAQNCWGFQRGLNIPFGRERGSYPDREMPG